MQRTPAKTEGLYAKMRVGMKVNLPKPLAFPQSRALGVLLRGEIVTVPKTQDDDFEVRVLCNDGKKEVKYMHII